jgi:ribosomal-protein-alanine N-acetyltransferase
MIPKPVFLNFPQLETERLILRELHTEDAPDVYEIFANPEVTKFYDVSLMRKTSEAEKLILWWARRYKRKLAIRWGITLKNSAQVIGTCGFSELDLDNRLAEIGYDLGYAYWGKGVMTEAVRAMVNFGFTSALQINRIETWVTIQNTRSVRILEKIGMNREGTLRQRQFWMGEFYDVDMYSLLRSEYLAQCEN